MEDDLRSGTPATSKTAENIKRGQTESERRSSFDSENDRGGIKK